MRIVTLKYAIGLPVLVAVAAVGVPSRAAPRTGRDDARKLRVLVVTGGHDFDRAPFEAMFNSFADITWSEAAHPSANDRYAPAERGGFDVVALYDMPSEITDQQKTWFIEMLKQGKGLVVLHHALGGYPKWPEYWRIVGGRFLFEKQTIDGIDYAPSTYRDDVEQHIHIADTGHPIVRGMQDYTIVDEVYGGFWISPKAHALLTIDHPESGHVVGWTNRYGRSRVVYLQGGHGPSAYTHATYRELVHRSLLWAASRLR